MSNIKTRFDNTKVAKRISTKIFTQQGPVLDALKNNAPRIYSISINVASRLLGSSATTTAEYPSASNPLPKGDPSVSTVYISSTTTHNGPGSVAVAVATLAGLAARSAGIRIMQPDWDAYLQPTSGWKFIKSTDTDILTQFATRFAGSPAKIVRYAPTNYDQFCAARTLAGCLGAIAVPSNVNLPVATTVVADCAQIFAQAGSVAAFYQTIWNRVSAQVSKSAISLTPGTKGTEIANTDYIVFAKLFNVNSDTFYSNSTVRNLVLSGIRKSYPALAAQLGYIWSNGGEPQFVETVGGAGYLYSACDRTPNLASWSSGPSINGELFPEPPDIAYDPNQKYIVVNASQSDTLDWSGDNNTRLFEAEVAAAMPAGLNCSQVTQEIMPQLNRWYIGRMKSTTVPYSMMSGPSGGIGYDHPHQFVNNAGYWALMASVCRNAGILDLFFLDDMAPVGWNQKPAGSTQALAQTYITRLQAAGFTPRSLWFWAGPNGVTPQIYNGVPVITAAQNPVKVETTASSVASAVKAAGSNFVCMFFNTKYPTQSGCAAIKTACANQGLKMVAPSQFANLVRQAHGLSKVRN